jgi:hypothetical protein
MTGPEHYSEAERLLAAANAISGDNADYADLAAWRNVASDASRQGSDD